MNGWTVGAKLYWGDRNGEQHLLTAEQTRLVKGQSFGTLKAEEEVALAEWYRTRDVAPAVTNEPTPAEPAEWSPDELPPMFPTTEGPPR